MCDAEAHKDQDPLLAVTVEWKLPTETGPKQPPVTRYSVEAPMSISTVVEATERAKCGVNDILTHLVEKGSWPQSLSAEIAPECPHGFPYTELECRYSPSHWTKDGLLPNQVIAKYVKAMLAHSPTELLENTGGQLDAAYGEGSNEKIDIYGSDVLPATAPVFAFVHGGYWQEGSRKQATVMVQNLFRQGVITAVVGYDLAPSFSLSTIIDQTAKALSFLNDFCTRQGSNGLYLCGHSAGAHLVAQAAMTKSDNLDQVKGMFLISGVYDLVPLIGTYIDRPIGLTLDKAHDLSPTHQIRNLSEPSRRFLSEVSIKIVVGAHESAAFHDQNQQFFNLLNTLELLIDPGYRVIEHMDHFSLIESLDTPDSALSKLLCNWMGLATG